MGLGLWDLEVSAHNISQKGRPWSLPWTQAELQNGWEGGKASLSTQTPDMGQEERERWGPRPPGAPRQRRF